MAPPINSRPSDALTSGIRKASKLQKKASQLVSQMAPGSASTAARRREGDKDSEQWHALMQAHLANITSHKALLEALAQGMSAQQNLDMTLVAQMEGMYSRTAEILEQARSVKAYFDSLAPSKEQAADSKAAIVEPSSEAPQRPSVTLSPQSPTNLVERRRHRDADDDQSTEETAGNKRRRVVESRTVDKTPTPAPPEPVIEYEDVTKEVLRRIAATRERRLAKLQANQAKANTDVKRKRRSTDSERSLVEVELRDIHSRPKKKHKNRPIPNDTAKTDAHSRQEGGRDITANRAVDADRGSTIPGSFSVGKELDLKKALRRVKSIV